MTEGLVPDLNECLSTTSDAKNFLLNLLTLTFLLWGIAYGLSSFPLTVVGPFTGSGLGESESAFPTAFVGPFVDCIHSCRLG